MTFEANTEILLVREPSHVRDLRNRHFRVLEELGAPLEADVHNELLDGHSRDVLDLLVEDRTPDRHVRDELIHVVVVVVHILLEWA